MGKRFHPAQKLGGELNAISEKWLGQACLHCRPCKEKQICGVIFVITPPFLSSEANAKIQKTRCANGKVSKWFDDFQALNDVDLTIYEEKELSYVGHQALGSRH